MAHGRLDLGLISIQTCSQEFTRALNAKTAKAAPLNTALTRLLSQSSDLTVLEPIMPARNVSTWPQVALRNIR